MDLEPRGRAVDAGTLLRSLYEHLVHFAWLAADPSTARIQEWHKHDLQMRLKADNDARRRERSSTPTRLTLSSSDKWPL